MVFDNLTVWPQGGASEQLSALCSSGVSSKIALIRIHLKITFPPFFLNIGVMSLCELKLFPMNDENLSDSYLQLILVRFNWMLSGLA